MQIKNARVHACGVSNLDLRSKGLIPRTELGFSLHSLRQSLRQSLRTRSPKSLSPRSAKRLLSLDRSTHTHTHTQSQRKLPALRSSSIDKEQLAGGSRGLWSRSFANEAHPTTHSKRVKRVGNLLPPETQALLLNQEPAVAPLVLPSPPLSPRELSEREVARKVRRVNYLRTMLRNRYMHRHNLMAMFRSWDRNLKGFLDARDVHHMLNSIGIACDLQESSCLVACADLNKDKRISAAEFMHMVISYDDKVALDPRAVRVEDYLEPGTVELEDQFREQELKNRELKEINQLKYFIKNKVPQAALEFKIFDRAEIEQGLRSQGLKSYTVTFEGFTAALNKLQLPANLHNNSRVYQTLFSSFGGDPRDEASEISYKAFLDRIATYEYDPYETIHTRQQQMLPRSKSLAALPTSSDRKAATSSSRLFRIEDPRNMAIMDRRSAATNTLEKIFRSTKKIIDTIKERCGVRCSQDAQALLEAQVGVQEDVVLDSHLARNGKVSKLGDLKRFVREVCAEDFKRGKLKAADLMGFLSSVSMNPKYQTIYIDSVSHMFDLDQNKLMRVVYDHSALGPPPPRCQKLKQVASKSEVSEKRLGDIKFKLGQLTSDASSLFWRFDPDHDGYASYEDMARVFKRMLLCEDEAEGLKIVSRLDPSLKGYLSFDEFVSAFELNEFVPESCALCPDPEHEKRRHAQSVLDIKSAFVRENQPERRGILVAPTRFGNTFRPETFVNFREEGAQAPKNQGSSLQNCVAFQREQKNFNFLRKQAIFARKQQALSRYEHNIAAEVERRQELADQRVAKKAARLQMYETMNHH